MVIRVNIHDRGGFCIKGQKFPSYSWEGIMQAFPRVTHGKDLCKTRHQSLMGRNYATLIIYDWYTISREGFMQNAKRVGTLPLVCN